MQAPSGSRTGSGVTPHSQWRDRAGFGSDIGRDRLPVECNQISLFLSTFSLSHLLSWFWLLFDQPFG